jgi:hypothetical protein
MSTQAFGPIRDESLHHAAQRIRRILESEEAAKRREKRGGTSALKRTAMPLLSESEDTQGLYGEEDFAQAIAPFILRPIPLQAPMIRPLPPLIDPIPPLPVPSPDARRPRRNEKNRKRCIDLFVKCYEDRWSTSPGWRCENCQEYCIANGEWPYQHCSPRSGPIAGTDDHRSRNGSCSGRGCSG